MQEVFPKYPDITQKLQDDCAAQYKRHIYKPLREQRQVEIAIMNKKSHYRQV